MSRRALRRLRGEQRGQEEPGLGELGLDPGPERGQEGLPSATPGRARGVVSNRFELVRGVTVAEERLGPAAFGALERTWGDSAGEGAAGVTVAGGVAGVGGGSWGGSGCGRGQVRGPAGVAVAGGCGWGGRYWGG